MRGNAMQCAEVDLDEHRHDHQPDQQTDRNVDVRDLESCEHLEGSRRKLPQRNTGDDAQRNPQREPTLEQAERGSSRHGCDRGVAHAVSRPISRILFCRDNRSSFAMGRLAKSWMRVVSRWHASENALRLASSLPSTVAGSGTPQCATTGCPGHTGQTSPAALSQTVMTKSSGGESACANSDQLLLRRSSVDMRFALSNSSASGLTLPTGWLPAL